MMEWKYCRRPSVQTFVSASEFIRKNVTPAAALLSGPPSSIYDGGDIGVQGPRRAAAFHHRLEHLSGP